MVANLPDYFPLLGCRGEFDTTSGYKIIMLKDF
jgi:hypothetical protein